MNKIQTSLKRIQAKKKNKEKQSIDQEIRDFCNSPEFSNLDRSPSQAEVLYIAAHPIGHPVGKYIENINTSKCENILLFYKN